jgi:hypothetical protein
VSNTELGGRGGENIFIMDCIKKLFVFKFLFLIVLFTSCDESKGSKNQDQNTSSACEIVGKDIIIKDNYAYVNKFIYDNLLGKNGTYTVYAFSHRTDYYGNRTETKHRIGSINADELNKFEAFRFWETRTSGVTNMLTRFREKDLKERLAE